MGVLAVAPEAVWVLLGEKWMPMVLTLQVFSFLAVIRPLSASVSPVFMGMGRPDLNIRAGLVVTAVMVSLAMLLLGRGIAGVATAVMLSHFAGFGYNLVQMHRMLPGIVPSMMKAIMPSLAAGGVMMLGVQLSKVPVLRLAGGQQNLPSLAALIAIGVLIYVLLSVLLQHSFIREAAELMLSALGLKGWIARHRGQKRTTQDVCLNDEERSFLLHLLESGEKPPPQRNRARILLLADEGQSDEEIAVALDTNASSVKRTRQRFVESGLGLALGERVEYAGGEPMADFGQG
jgi:hypothetical protein